MGIDFTVFKGDEPSRAPDCLVKITHSGICGTDEHFKPADMTLGHEGVGIVEQIGEAVKGLKIGDVVGWGFAYEAQIYKLTAMIASHDNYCAAADLYGAAPLMCGGAAVWGVIDTYNIRPTDKVGVVGVGGLGHHAIQFLTKMGVRVAVFSSTEEKRALAVNLGAAEFYVIKGATALEIEPFVQLFP
ncbi:chaperonin 10-like protein [Mycena latifolia]|nr:chaperonin 10-like protein [Mycena latifolia]